MKKRKSLAATGVRATNRPARSECLYRALPAKLKTKIDLSSYKLVHDPKPPMHSHNCLSFGKFQDTERFLIHCERHFSSRLPPSGGTWKYAKAHSTKKKLGDILNLLICSFLPCLSWLLRSRVRKSRRDL